MSARDSDRVQVQLGVEPVERVAPAAPGTPFRIAVLGDFSGRSSRAGAAPRDVADRFPVVVDRDDLDEVLARIAPELHLPTDDGGAAEVLRVTELDQLHPDSLYERLPSLAALRNLRTRVADPATSRQAIRQLLGEPGRPAASAPGAGQPHTAPAGGSLLEQIVTEAAGPEPFPPAPRQPAPALEEDQLSRFVRQVVAGHIVDPGDPRQAEVLAGLDSAVAARMRTVLHDRAFQALEALWRGMQLLVRRLDTGQDLKVYLVDVTRDELAADLEGEAPLESTGLYRLLVEGSVGTPGAAPWALLVGCYTFGPLPADVALLARLAGIARAAGAPWLSAAAPALAGFASFAETPEPESWSAPAAPEWAALRRQPTATSLGLVAPRFLLRLPYGRDGDECERFPFEELASPEHEHFLWGNGALVAALLLAESFSDDAWGLRPGSRAELDGLPLHLVRVAGETRTIPCAEALMPERTAALVLEAGVMPLASLKDRDTVRIVRFQSIASPVAALAGGWRGDRR